MLSNRKTYSTILIYIVTSILGLSGCMHPAPEPEKLTVVQAAGSIPEREYLEQNWDEQTRKAFWFTSQGSQIIPYKWFVYLERANSDQLFRNVDHMNSLRYIPVDSSSINPGGLPIGFSPDFDQQTGNAWLGLTCSACHTNQLNYEGKKILIEGAPTLANFTRFFSELIDALDSTVVNERKFQKFASNVLGPNPSDGARETLMEDMRLRISRLYQRQKINSPHSSDYPKDFIGFARLDAFGQIANQNAVFGMGLHLDNASIANAPVSYPFLWGTPQSDVVQWNGSARNTPIIGPLVRNVGEVTGVFGKLKIDPAPWWRFWDFKHSYTSTVQFKALGQLEDWIVDLRSPQWPDQLPTVDSIKAAQGEMIYQLNCSSCHKFIDRKDEGNNYKAVMTPVKSIKTDSTMAWNIVHHTAKTYILEGKKQFVIAGEPFGPETAEIDITINGVIGLILEHPIKSLEAGLKSLEKEEIEKHLQTIGLEGSKNIEVLKTSLEEHLKSNSKSSDETLKYKARPLNGIWATAPYLHNGSVPNLWQLLQEPQSRDKSFYVGSREFDPLNVGFNTTEIPGSTTLFQVEIGPNKPIPGNSNAGHGYGTMLSDEDKWALIEYMKTL